MSRTPLVSFATRSDDVAARLVEDAVAVGVAVQEKDIELAVGVSVEGEVRSVGTVLTKPGLSKTPLPLVSPGRRS
jgi:hypothetical protein